jgi:diguanylate cyclase (GGDEF)-like protein
MLPTVLRESARTDRYGSPLCAIMMDIDHYKEINDRHGHVRGDEVLQRFSEIVQTNIRGTDYFVRYGGDEFLILLAATHITRARDFAEKIRHLVEAQDFGEGIRVTVSAGVAEYIPGETGEIFIQHADKRFTVPSAAAGIAPCLTPPA